MEKGWGERRRGKGGYFLTTFAHAGTGCTGKSTSTSDFLFSLPSCLKSVSGPERKADQQCSCEQVTVSCRDLLFALIENNFLIRDVRSALEDGAEMDAIEPMVHSGASVQACRDYAVSRTAGLR
eukprot:702747-Hanusia_phi.AAC.2